MVKEFEIALKEHLKTFGETRFYLGEFNDPKELELVTANTPMIFIDFQGDEEKQLHSKTCHWNLYFLAKTVNKSEAYREKAQHELIDFIEKIDQSLESESFEDSSPIELMSLKKIFNDITDNGYLTVYSRGFKTEIFMQDRKFFN